MAKSSAKLKVAKSPAKAPRAAQGTSEFFKLVKEHGIEYVSFRFTDLRGKLQHTAQHISTVDESLLEDGIMFDGSSIAGWKAINESDMILQPDLATAKLDPFSAQPTLDVFCDVFEPSTGQPYTRDPRSIAKAAEKYLKATGIADTGFFGPEAEFFIFDDVRIEVSMNRVGYAIDSMEGPYNSGTEYEGGNMGHRPGIKGGYFPVQPVDSSNDIRGEMTSVLSNMGVPMEKHHHEVAPSQVELGLKFSTLVDSADNMQLYKYVVHNVAHAYGKSATFLPKPVYGDNGSGMHVHQSLWKAGKPLFAGSGYADLSETCLHYIGGIIKHAKALNAITNPTTNSYKRLVPGYEAPVLLAYSARNRSASCRIPFAASPKGKRVEVRFPDPAANTYLAFAAMLMAGLDGIQKKIHPGDAMDKNLYDLPPDELAEIPTVCGSLREALDHLRDDHEFLLKGGVFTEDFIESYLELRYAEVKAFETMPHPIEFAMYYSV
jgi:glutamine synthetase